MSLKIVHSTISDKDRRLNEWADLLTEKWRAKQKKKVTIKQKPRA